MPHEHKGDVIARAHREFRSRRQILAVGWNVRPERQRVGAGDRPQMAVDLAYPRHDAAVVEPDDELHFHGDLTGHSLDDADHIRLGLTRGHEIDDANHSGIALEFGFENQCVVAIAPAAATEAALRRNEPSTVGFAAEKSREARARIETRKTEPVD